MSATTKRNKAIRETAAARQKCGAVLGRTSEQQRTTTKSQNKATHESSKRKKKAIRPKALVEEKVADFTKVEDKHAIWLRVTGSPFPKLFFGAKTVFRTRDELDSAIVDRDPQAALAEFRKLGLPDRLWFLNQYSLLARRLPLPGWLVEMCAREAPLHQWKLPKRYSSAPLGKRVPETLYWLYSEAGSFHPFVGLSLLPPALCNKNLLWLARFCRSCDQGVRVEYISGTTLWYHLRGPPAMEDFCRYLVHHGLIRPVHETTLTFATTRPADPDEDFLFRYVRPTTGEFSVTGPPMEAFRTMMLARENAGQAVVSALAPKRYVRQDPEGLTVVRDTSGIKVEIKTRKKGPDRWKLPGGFSYRPSGRQRWLFRVKMSTGNFELQMPEFGNFSGYFTVPTKKYALKFDFPRLYPITGPRPHWDDEYRLIASLHKQDTNPESYLYPKSPTDDQFVGLIEEVYTPLHDPVVIHGHTATLVKNGVRWTTDSETGRLICLGKIRSSLGAEKPKPNPDLLVRSPSGAHVLRGVTVSEPLAATSNSSGLPSGSAPARSDGQVAKHHGQSTCAAAEHTHVVEQHHHHDDDCECPTCSFGSG